jgi:uncharacterized membrane protein
MSTKLAEAERRLVGTLLISSGVSLLLLAVRVFSADSNRYGFLPFNLALAWLPLLFGWVLCRRLLRHRWQEPINVVLTLLWLGFLPNSFYLVSDLIHLQPTGEISQLFDVVLFVSFVWNGFLLGLISLFMVHGQLRRRVGKAYAYRMVMGVLLLCSYAIYLGRYLRWNSWDTLVNPLGLIFDVSDAFLHPGSHHQAFSVTIMFFFLLMSIYAVTYELINISRRLLPRG